MIPEFEGPLGVMHHFSDGLYAKKSYIKRGATIPQHAHDHGHLSILASGWVRVTVDGLEGPEIKGPCCFEIEAGKEHSVRALTDAVWFCIWPDTKGDVEQFRDGP